MSRTRPRRRPTPRWDPAAHRPYRSALIRTPAVGDPCPVPDDVAHCHGMLVEHIDDVRECHAGPECEAPDGMHLASTRCATAHVPVLHRCTACRPA